ncbi:MAG: hypothetical protein ACOWYE_14945 [Desulfatiglandales bacterium]
MKKVNFFLVLAATVLAFGCGTPVKQEPPTPINQIRPIEALPTEVAADTITVAQFRYVCDAMARDFIRQPFVVRAARPPVVTVRKIQNKTGQYIDEQIFQETIRVKLMENAGGLVLFRDDVSYKDIVQERVRQSNEELTVTLTDTVLEKKTYDRVKDREYESGSLSGASGTSEHTANVEEESNMDMSQTASVKSGIAAADYFLRGIIYQVNERDMTEQNRGMSYFQYQFRVVDARSGLIVWEKMLSNKMAGEYMLAPKANAADPNDPNATQGQVPSGWPTGTVSGQPGLPQGQTNTQGVQQPVSQQNPVEMMKQITDQLVPVIQQMQK